MENSYGRSNGSTKPDPKLQIVRHPLYYQPPLPWFDLRVFYIRISKFSVDDSTPECLTLNHIPLSPDTLLEVNGVQCKITSSSILRRDRVDKKSEEATFISTDSIKLAGDVKFEVFNKQELVLNGVLEMSCNSNSFTWESKNLRRWSMKCEPVMSANCGFLKGRQIVGSEAISPTVEVYVAGCFGGTPIILTKTLQLGFRKNLNRKGMLDSIPEYEAPKSQKNDGYGLDLQVSEYRNYKPENEEDYNNMYWGRTEYMEGEDGELSWFNAGVRVGVGIGLGVCLGVGVGVGLLVRTYQATTRNFRSRFI